MDALTAKARGILLRLPHFYHPDGAGPLLLDVVGGAGRALERAEADLYRVLRSHHVETAEQDAAGGYTAPLELRGDLDKVLAQYLEVLGGTSNLVRVSPAFTARSIDARRLARDLSSESALVDLLSRRLDAGTLKAIRRPPDSGVPLAAARRAARVLLRPDPGTPEAEVRSRLTSGTRRRLDAYDGGEALDPDTARALAAELRRDPDPLLAYLEERLAKSTRTLLDGWRVENARIRPAEVRAGLARALLLAEPGTLEAYAAARLTPPTRARLERYDGRAELDPALAAALADDLNEHLLTDPQLYPRFPARFEVRPDDDAPAARAVRGLRGGIYRDLLRARAAAEPDAALAIEAELDAAEAVSSPPGEDLVRLNRLLLERAWAFDATARPWGLRETGIPPLAEVRAALVDELNRLLDDPALAREERFPARAEELPALRERHAARPQWLNRVLLEGAFPRAVEPSYAAYRERLLALIQVLRRGASTRRGILDVVAANLGILGSDREARQAKALIQVHEYDPEQVTFFANPLQLWDAFTVDNPNPVEAEAQIRVRMRKMPFERITALRFTEEESNAAVEFPGELRAGDLLVLRGRRAEVNGVEFEQELADPVPTLPPGRSRWRFEARVVVPGTEAALDEAVPLGRFNEAPAAALDASAFAPDEAAVEVEVASEKHHPGVFTVVIPWNIPGFTDKFEAEDHPRQQILGLVNRVKAAGVEARVAYYEIFREEHRIEEALTLQLSGRGLREAHESADAWRAVSEQAAREQHAMEDALVLTAAFDRTSFDSLNTFA